MKRQTVVEIIAKSLPYVKGMREAVARDVYDEIIGSGYVITFQSPYVPRVPSADLAHYRKRNEERKTRRIKR